MYVSQKCQYAIRALMDLAKRHGQGPVPTSATALSQAVPQRFLEVIMNELKAHGLVVSRRGVRGGYELVRDPSGLTVGEVIRLIDGPLDPVRCTQDWEGVCCPLKDGCSLIDLWRRAKQAVEAVYDGMTIAQLAAAEAREVSPAGEELSSPGPRSD